MYLQNTNGLYGLRCLGFDGRIDSTKSFVDKEGYSQLQFVEEDHYAIVSYPRNVYVDHVAPQTSH